MSPRRRPASAARSSLREAREALYRGRVVDAAESLFAERGSDSTKMEEIAEEAGLSLGTLYAVFRGKAGILESLHEARLRELLHHSIATTRGLDDPLEVLVAGVRGYVEFFLAHPDYLRIHLGDTTSWGLPIAGGSPRASVWQEGQRTLVGTLERGIAQGIFYADDPSRLARACAAIGEIRLGDWLVSGMADEAERVLADVERMVRRALCRRPEDRDPPPNARLETPGAPGR